MVVPYKDWLTSLHPADSDWKDIYAASWGQGSWEGLDKPMSIKTDWENSTSASRIPRVIENVRVERLQGNSNLFVFHSYPYLLTRILATLDDPRVKNNPTRPVAPLVLTGTPGIGKSVFLIFFIIHMLRLREPLVYYRTGYFYFFSEDGVKKTTEFPLLEISRETIPYRLKFLIDGDLGMPRVFVLDPSRFFIIQVAMPSESHHYKWTKQYYGRTFIMNPHPESELVQCVNLTQVPRTLKYRKRMVIAAARCFYPNIRVIQAALVQTFKSERDLFTSEITDDLLGPSKSHTLLKIVSHRPPPEPSDRGHGFTDVALHIIANQTALRLLIAHQRIWFRNQVHEFLRVQSLRLSPPSKECAGWLFEAYAYDAILKGGTFNVKRLLPDSFLQDSPLETLTLPAPCLASDVKTFLPSDPASTTSADKSYYIPLPGKNPTFDAFMLNGNEAVAFQMTLAHGHTLKHSGLSMLQRRFSNHPNKNLVFVIPPGHDFRIASSTHPFVSQLSMWVMELAVESEHSRALRSLINAWGEGQREEDDFDDML